MPPSDCFVSVVAPLWNEAALVPSFVQEVMEVLRSRYASYELVLVDDGSTDATLPAVSAQLQAHPSIRLIRLSRHFGADIAMTSGLDTAIGDYVVAMLPASDPPRLIPELVEECRRGKDVLFGVRLDASKDPWLMRFARRVFYGFSRRILRLEIPEHATYFQVFSRQALNALNRIKDKHRHMRLLSAHIGFENRTFHYEPAYRAGRPPPPRWREAFGLALGLVTASSANPLRFVSLMGLLASVLNGLYVIYVIAIYLFKKNVAEGWTTLSLQNAGLFFWVFLILTVLSEYIGRILGELKERPLYYTLEEKNSSVLTPDPDRRNVAASPKEE